MVPYQKKITPRSILNLGRGFLSSFDFTINPYSGCTWNCQFCYAPKHLFDAERELHWGEWLNIKANASDLLTTAVALGQLDGSSIFMSSVTDPYVPEEARWQVTRRCLEVLVRQAPRRLVIQTRGPGIERDLDLLRDMGEVVIVSFSFSSDKDDVRRVLEPSCASIHRRVSTLARLHQAGVRVYATLAPVLTVDPKRFLSLVEPYVEGIIVSGLNDDGAGGANLRVPARELIQEHGWSQCFDLGYASQVWRAFEQLRPGFAWLGRAAFSRLANIP